MRQFSRAELVAFIEARLETFSESGKASRIHGGTSIPSKKLDNARGKYAVLDQCEQPVLLFDDTVFGSSKKGLILTDKALHYHLQKNRNNKKKVKGSVAASEIISVRFEKAGLGGADVFVNDTMIGTTTMLGERNRRFLTDLFGDLMASDATLQKDCNMSESGHVVSPDIPASSQAASQTNEKADSNFSGVGAAVGIFFGGWVVLALGWNLIGTEPDASPAEESSAQAPADIPSEPAVAQSAVPERSSEPSAEYKALVAKIMAPNTLGAPMALDAAALQRNPSHGEMLNMLTQATYESPQSDRISELNNDDPTFAIVYFDCYGDKCERRQAKRGRPSWMSAKDEAEAWAKAQVNTRCFEKHQNDGEWPREVFECVMGEYNALIELAEERKPGVNIRDKAEFQRLDSCLSRFIRGNKARFAEANACVAKAQNGPPVGYSFAQANQR